MVVISWRVMGFLAGVTLLLYLLSRRCDPEGRSGRVVRRLLWGLGMLWALALVTR